MGAENFDLSAVQQYHRGLLEKALDGPDCTLCLDRALEPLLKIVLEAKGDLKSALPPQVKELCWADGDPITCSRGAKVIFFLYSRHQVISQVGELINGIASAGAKVYVYVAPRNTLLVEHMFASMYCREHIRLLKDLEIDLGLADEALLTMEQADSTRELLTESSPAVLHTVARSLMKLQVFYGPFGTVRRVGSHAESVSRVMEQMSTEAADIYDGQASRIHTLFLFDRSCDLLNPAVTQGTYGGYLCDLMHDHIDCRFTFRPPFEVKDSDGKTLSEFRLTATGDPVFSEIRDAAYAGVGSLLQRKAQAIQGKYQERENLKNIKQTREYMRSAQEYMQQIKGVLAQEKLLAGHIDIFKKLKDAVSKDKELELKRELEDLLLRDANKEGAAENLENLIYQGTDFGLTLKCLAVFCIVSGGLPPKVHEKYHVLLHQQYGAKALTAWNTMEEAGVIFTNKDRRAAIFPALRKRFGLYARADYITDPVHCVSYGLAPIIPKLVEKVVTPRDWGAGWREVAEAASLLGPVDPKADDTEVDLREPGKTRVAIVFVLGGLTLSELGALRNLQEHLSNESEAGQPVQLIIATTCILRGNAFSNSLV